MPAREEITYWGAGPALMPTEVLEQAAKALVNYNDTGLGIAEHSHRSTHASDIVNDAKALLASYLSVPTEKYEILFMQAGGTGEFSATICNLVGSWVAKKQAAGTSEEDLKKVVDSSLKVDYVVTGGWSEKASKEARRLLGDDKVNIVSDSRKSNNGKFGTLAPESDWSLSSDAAYVYYCDNETVDGVEFPGFPEVLKPKADGSGPIVVADMSSNILSRPIPVENYGVIFFGAQKNFGITGITVAIVRKDLMPQPAPEVMRKLGLPLAPIILTYSAIAKENSLYNTLSIFDVHIAQLVLKRLLALYPDKVAGQAVVSGKKADLIYSALEAHPEVYKIVPAKECRSRMNICFRVAKGGDMDAAEKAFLKESTALGLTGLKGHRSVGGIRASNYNSVPLAGAERLANFINTFAPS